MVFFLFDLDRYLTLEAVKANRDGLLAFVQAHEATAVALYIATYCVVVAVSLPGAAVLTLVGGFLFGALSATLYVNVAATTGAVMAFLAARYLLRDWVERQFGSRLEPIQEGFRKNAFSYLLTLRLIPIFPFFLVNLVAGLTHVPLRSYVIATSIGIIPGTFVFAYAGRQLGTINSVSEIASPTVLLAFALLGALALIPAVYRTLHTGKGQHSRKPTMQGRAS